MATTPEYKDFILDQLSSLDGIRCRPMMGEYLLYVQDKLFGGIYDNRLLVKPLPTACSCLPNPQYETPYPGAKEMLLVEDPEDRATLELLVKTLCNALPAPKPKQKKPKVQL